MPSGLAVVAALVLLAASSPGPVLGEDSRMIIVPGKTFDPSVALEEVVTLANSCKCKMMCLVSTSCAAWSTIRQTTSSVECRLTDLSPPETTLLDQTDTVYGYKLSALESEIGVREEADGLLYIKPPYRRSFQGMRDYCKSIPGFRLLILKTIQQFEISKKLGLLCKGCLLDLKKTSHPSTLEWGDGTILPVEHLPYIARMGAASNVFFQFVKSGRIEYASNESRRYFICQGSDKSLW